MNLAQSTSMAAIDPTAIQNQALVKMGLHVFGPSPTEGEEVHIVAITSESFKQTAGTSLYTAQEDIVRELPDGRLIKELRKGETIPESEAIRRGYIKVQEPPKPKEKKPGAGPSETK